MSRLGRIKLVAFDLDGTLVRENSSWGKIHRFFNTVNEEKRILKMYLEGEIDYKEFMRRDISLWPKPLHISQIEKILLSYELVDGSEEVLKELKKLKVNTAIISGGIDILANNVARRLGIKHVVANGLEIDEEGFLTGEGIKRVDPFRKHEALINLASKVGVKKENIMAVGDSRYDKSFLKYAGVGVSLKGDDELAEVADYIADSIREVPLIVRRINLSLGD